ncbi:DUF2837 family protein [Enterococcus hirae]|nr:DUF2837 family protein [Enterococcus hirae]
MKKNNTNNKKQKSLKKKTKKVVLGATLATALGTSFIPSTTSFAEENLNSNEVSQIENPYKLLLNTLNSKEFKQACNEKNAKKVANILQQLGIITPISPDNRDVGVVAIPFIAFENFAVVSFVALAVAAAVALDQADVNVLDTLKVKDPGLQFILSDVYKETGDEAFVHECYNAIVSL